MMKSVVPAVAVLFFSLAVAAQSRNQGRQELNGTLADLERVSQATQVDIASMRIDKWSSGWKPGFLGKSSHTKEAQHLALSLRRNMEGVLPGMISDARSSRGSMSSSFKLYDDVSVLCDTLNSLATATQIYGKKGEYGPLVQDFNAMSRVRRNLSVYIEQKAAAVESRGVAPVYASSYAPARPVQRVASSTAAAAPLSTTQATQTTTGTLPKKIIIDDNIPETKPAKKKAAVQYSNVY
ncbi:MAG TPA: hypothetical protein VFI72_06890 [Candidatus Angelobacter sp.]|nr:hypothetical protein [Candidatus Angelobacter sp.]